MTPITTFALLYNKPISSFGKKGQKITKNIVKTPTSKGIHTTSVKSFNAEEPALTRVYGGLQDQDRIFSNIYGEQSWRIDDAVKRGDWHRTKDLCV